MSAALRIESVSAGYGDTMILHDVSLEVPGASIVAVVGPNGSGKSTLMKVAVGLLGVAKGRVWLGERDVTSMGAPMRVRAGIAYVPQERNVFRNLSVDENLRLGIEFLSDGAKTARERREAVFTIFPALRGRLKDLAGNLSGGQRQMLAMGSALMANPSVLLLDEPSAGLSPKYAEEMFAAVRRMNASGITIFMIEQNTAPALRCAGLGVVLAAGSVRAVAPAAELAADPEMKKLYLGG